MNLQKNYIILFIYLPGNIMIISLLAHTHKTFFVHVGIKCYNYWCLPVVVSWYKNALNIRRTWTNMNMATQIDQEKVLTF